MIWMKNISTRLHILPTKEKTKNSRDIAFDFIAFQTSKRGRYPL